MRASDAKIQQDVIEELKWDTRVDETDVGVEVDDGVVTLTGTVGSYLARMAARQAAHQVRGVLDVVDNVKVKPAGVRTDTDIALSIRQALEWHPALPHELIRTTVSNGMVTLEGEVKSWQQRGEAEQIVGAVAGVKDTRNVLSVLALHVDPAQIRESIQEALERRAERESDRIRILVENGVVTLAGAVRTYGDKEAILGAAGHAPGVKRVESQLRIEPSS